jgi:hypothetical protein
MSSMSVCIASECSAFTYLTRISRFVNKSVNIRGAAIGIGKEPGEALATCSFDVHCKSALYSDAKGRNKKLELVVICTTRPCSSINSFRVVVFVGLNRHHIQGL